MAKADSVVIVSACRTAVGTFQGTLSALPAHALGEIAVREALKVWIKTLAKEHRIYIFETSSTRSV